MFLLFTSALHSCEFRASGNHIREEWANDVKDHWERILTLSGRPFLMQTALDNVIFPKFSGCGDSGRVQTVRIKSLLELIIVKEVTPFVF